MDIRKKFRDFRDSPVVLATIVFILKRLRRWSIFRTEAIYKHVPYRGDFEVGISNNEFFRMRSRGGQIENQLFWDGALGHEPRSMSAWITLSRRARTVLDLGANSGLFALAASAAGAKSIHAFEPIKRINAYLEENVQLSGFDNVTIWCLAVGSSNADAQICDPGGDAPTSASLSESFAQVHLTSIERVPVKVVSIDSWSEAHNILSVDLIKLDVEGLEEHALKGMKELVWRDRPTILIEVLPEYEKRLRQLVHDLWGTAYSWQPIVEGGNKVSRNVMLVPKTFHT